VVKSAPLLTKEGWQPPRLTGWFSPSTNDEPRTKMGTLNTKIGTLNTEIGTINTKIGTINTEIGTLNTEIGTIEFANFL
jgi:hypothetical protein